MDSLVDDSQYKSMYKYNQKLPDMFGPLGNSIKQKVFEE
jgi:hypothetical protein